MIDIKLKFYKAYEGLIHEGFGMCVLERLKLIIRYLHTDVHTLGGRTF